MKVGKLIVGKGRSISRAVDGEEEWKKAFYQVEATLDEGEDPVAARLGIEHMIDQWLQELTIPEAAIPDLDLADLDELPWKTYKTKEPAEPGHSGWMRNPLKWDNFDDPVAVDLAKALTRTGGKLELGEYVYRLSGKEKQFIGRRAIKKPTEEESKPKENPQGPHEKMERNLKNIKEGAERMGLQRW